MLLTIAKIVTLSSWIIILGFFLAYHYSLKKNLQNIQLPTEQSNARNAMLFIFYFLLYTILWTNGISLENRLLPEWALTSSFFGFILVIAGTYLMIWAIKTLYDKWRVSASMLDLSILQTNPFNFVRYPFYSAQIMIWLGSTLMFMNPLGFILGILMLVPILIMQVKKNEREFFLSYGNPYLEYKSRVGAFVPKIW